MSNPSYADVLKGEVSHGVGRKARAVADPVSFENVTAVFRQKFHNQQGFKNYERSVGVNEACREIVCEIVKEDLSVSEMKKLVGRVKYWKDNITYTKGMLSYVGHLRRM
ncbi:hypothetical protein ONE63_011475 [Megalurothrips usitatus]|uniref:Uncharacterized protein n=1 Tax=Megalurothrips usitatus TaxID=439358 RepID=A0AAV7X5H3_9NEOP|nr:hypothetical protein ONE63_011475 [Megalurothrips usitatus]